MKYKIKPHYLTLTKSRFRISDFPDYLSWQNAVYAAYEANPDDLDPKVKWMKNMILQVKKYESGEMEFVDISSKIDTMSDEELMESLSGKVVELTGLTREQRKRVLRYK